MIQLIAPELHDNFRDALAEMHRLRARVFRDRLDWAVEIHGDQEGDRFDLLGPHYLLQRHNGVLIGCVRFLPSTGPTMLRDTFSDLLDGGPVPARRDIWESSRFATDLPESGAVRSAGLSLATYELFAGMIEFALSLALTRIVTVTDARMERILRRAGWPLSRLGTPRNLGSTVALAGYLEVSAQSLAIVRSRGGLAQPVLWRPAIEGVA
jgi:N-acyl-L-homoserine lactone synthetase